jgi:Leucine-rich repeat (LRR) protein
MASTNNAEEIIQEACKQQSTSLNLSHCDLTVVPGYLSKALSLTKLQLNNNRLLMPPDEIGDLVNLQELSLDHNQLTLLPRALSALRNLTFLTLSHNPLGLLQNIFVYSFIVQNYLLLNSFETV